MRRDKIRIQLMLFKARIAKDMISNFRCRPCMMSMLANSK